MMSPLTLSKFANALTSAAAFAASAGVMPDVALVEDDGGDRVRVGEGGRLLDDLGGLGVAGEPRADVVVLDAR